MNQGFKAAESVCRYRHCLVQNRRGSTSDHTLRDVTTHSWIIPKELLDKIIKHITIMLIDQQRLVFRHRRALKIANGIRTKRESLQGSAKYGLVIGKLLQKPNLPTCRGNCRFIVLAHFLFNEMCDQFPRCRQAAGAEMKIVHI